MDKKELQVVKTLDKLADYWLGYSDSLDGFSFITSEGEIHPLAVNAFCGLEDSYKQYKKKYEEVRSALQSAMEECALKKVETDDCMVTYVEASDREYFNKKAFQQERPDEYDAYIEIRRTSPSIRVKIKGDKR